MVYEKLGKPMIEKVLEGFNCTIFAYGQVCPWRAFDSE